MVVYLLKINVKDTSGERTDWRNRKANRQRGEEPIDTEQNEGRSRNAAHSNQTKRTLTDRTKIDPNT